MRLVYALLAFPAAGLIGFAGQAVVKSAFTPLPAVTSPAPERTTDENASPLEPADAPESLTDNKNAAESV
jgi:hypothetical protein